MQQLLSNHGQASDTAAGQYLPTLRNNSAPNLSDGPLLCTDVQVCALIEPFQSLLPIQVKLCMIWMHVLDRSSFLFLFSQRWVVFWVCTKPNVSESYPRKFNFGFIKQEHIFPACFGETPCMVYPGSDVFIYTGCSSSNVAVVAWNSPWLAFPSILVMSLVCLHCVLS